MSAIDSMACPFRRSSTNKPTDHTGKVYNGWRCISWAYAFGGQTFWNVECDCGCGATGKKEIANRKRWPRCGCQKPERFTGSG